MSRPLSEEQIMQWRERIIIQRDSGLSIACWCRQNDVAVHVFYYWKKKLFQEQAIKQTSFTEISFEEDDDGSEMENSGIRLEYQKMIIHLDKQFDSQTLKQCLSMLKEEIC